MGHLITNVNSSWPSSRCVGPINCSNIFKKMIICFCHSTSVAESHKRETVRLCPLTNKFKYLWNVY